MDSLVSWLNGLLMQALEHKWLVSCGGGTPVQLAKVGRQVTKVARERRFKDIAHAVIAGTRVHADAMADADVEVCRIRIMVAKVWQRTGSLV
jgi:hypothetical protein